MNITITDIENKLIQKEQGTFQIICNEILSKNGLIPFDYTGAQQCTQKTIAGTPDSIFLDKNNKYIFVEYTTCEKNKLNNKIQTDVKKCLSEIKENKLEGKVSKIIFMHNRKQPKIKFIESMKKECNDISFEIYGSDYICTEIKNKYFNIAETYLELHDYSTIIKDQLKVEIQNENYKENINKINELYEEAIKITNTQLSLIYLTDEQKNKLKNIYTNLEKYEFLFKDKLNDESKNFYHNLLIILQRLDNNKYLEKFLELKENPNLNNNDLNFYADNLLNNNQVDEALNILEDLYYKKNFKESLNNLIRCYFIKEIYDKILELVSPLDIKEYDPYGQLATFYMFAKDKENNLSPNDILSYNSKFKDMPLFYISSSQLLYEKKNGKYKDQLKKAIKIIREDDYSSISIITDVSILLNQYDLVLKYLIKIKNPNDFIKYSILKIVQRKNEIKQSDIEIIEKYNKEIKKDDIDNNLISAIIYETKGLIIKAIKYYKYSYENKNNIYSFQKYIILSMNNNYEIDESIIHKLSSINDYRISLLISQYYCNNYNYKISLEYAYISIYLLKDNPNIDPYKQFWYIFSLCKNLCENKKYFTKDHVIILKKNKKEIIKYLIDDSKELINNSIITDLKILKSNDPISIKFIGRKKNEIINIDNDEYEVEYVDHKYNYICNYSFNKFKNYDGIEIIKGTADDPNGLQQISESIKKYSIAMDNKLDVYEKEKNYPISALLKGNYTFDNYAKLINSLMSKNHLLFAGESIETTLENGFVIDITTLIILTLTGKLNILNKYDSSNIYIPIGLKQKINNYINKLINSYDEKESTLGYSQDFDNQYNIALFEVENSKKLDLWKNLNDYINKFTILDTEFEYDSIINKTALQIIDKVQLDSIAIAKEKNIPYICDDLFIRQLSNQYKVSHSNTIFLLNYKEKNIDLYIENIIELSKYNYIYSFYNLEYSHLMHFLMKNFTKENLIKFENIMESISNNEKSKDFYKDYFNKIKSNLEKIKYIKIFDEIFENNLATFIIECINKYFN